MPDAPRITVAGPLGLRAESVTLKNEPPPNIVLTYPRAAPIQVLHINVATGEVTRVPRP